MEHAEHLTTPEPDHRAGPGYELRDTNVRVVTTYGVALVALIVVVNLALLAAYERLRSLREREETPIPAENLARQRTALQEHEENTLSGYRYDRATGVVRISIARAIELVAERGVPKGKGPRTEEQINSRDIEEKGERRE